MKQLNITLGNHNKTMHFVFGFANKEKGFDPLDNPYVDVKVYKMTHGEVLNDEPDFSIRNCTQEELNVFIKPRKQVWYPNALCFEKRDQVRFNGSWYMDEYAIPTIAIERCNSTKRQCANDS